MAWSSTRVVKKILYTSKSLGLGFPDVFLACWRGRVLKRDVILPEVGPTPTLEIKVLTLFYSDLHKEFAFAYLGDMISCKNHSDLSQLLACM